MKRKTNSAGGSHWIPIYALETQRIIKYVYTKFFCSNQINSWCVHVCIYACVVTDNINSKLKKKCLLACCRCFFHTLSLLSTIFIDFSAFILIFLGSGWKRNSISTWFYFYLKIPTHVFATNISIIIMINKSDFCLKGLTVSIIIYNCNMSSKLISVWSQTWHRLVLFEILSEESVPR